MKLGKILRSIAVCGLLAATAAAGAQTQRVPSNRYGMKLEQNADGTYSLLQQKKYDRLLSTDVSKLPGA